MRAKITAIHAYLSSNLPPQCKEAHVAIQHESSENETYCYIAENNNLWELHCRMLLTNKAVRIYKYITDIETAGSAMQDVIHATQKNTTVIAFQDVEDMLIDYYEYKHD